MSKLTFLKNEFEVKKALCDLLTEVTFYQAEAICYVLDKLDELNELKKDVQL